DGLGRRYVKAGDVDLTSAAPQARRGRVELAAVASVQDDSGAVLGEPTRDGEPDTLGRSGDKGALACEIEQFKCHGTMFSITRCGRTGPSEHRPGARQSIPSNGSNGHRSIARRALGLDRAARVLGHAPR